LQSAAWFGAPLDGEAVARAAADRDVDVTPLSRYYQGRRPAPEGLQLGFAAVDAAEIRRGVRELAAVLEAALRARGARSARAGAPRSLRRY
jgi:DNA-binding transcriptional MocR family regulator